MKDFISSKGGRETAHAANARSSAAGVRVFAWVGGLVVVGVLVVLTVLSNKTENTAEPTTTASTKRTPRTPDRKTVKASSQGDMPDAADRPAAKDLTTDGAQRAANPKTANAALAQDDSAVASTNDAPEAPPAPKKLARTAAEELLLMATPSTPGAMVPPLPDLSGADLDKSATQALRTPLEAEDGDDTKLLERKLVLAAQKEEFRDLRDGEGWRFKDYVEALRKKAESDSTYLAEATKVVADAEADESISDEEFKALKKKVNEALAERGIPALE